MHECTPSYINIFLHTDTYTCMCISILLYTDTYKCMCICIYQYRYRVRSRPVPGRKGPGRPKKTWEECVKQDLKVCGLSEAGTQDRLSWRSSVKNSRQEPTPSNGSLLQSMAAPPARRVLGMRTRSFNKTGFDWLIAHAHKYIYMCMICWGWMEKGWFVLCSQLQNLIWV